MEVLKSNQPEAGDGFGFDTVEHILKENLGADEFHAVWSANLELLASPDEHKSPAFPAVSVDRRRTQALRRGATKDRLRQW